MKFVRQSQMIKMINVDKVQTEIEVREHGNMPISICGIICSPTASNCSKTNVLRSLLESSHNLRFENMYEYSKSLQQPKY